MAKAVNCTVWKPCLFCQTIDYPVYSAEIDIRFSENSTHNETVAFVVAVAEYFSVFILPFLFSLQCLKHGIVKRYFAVTAFRFWCCNLSGYRLTASCSAFCSLSKAFCHNPHHPKSGQAARLFLTLCRAQAVGICRYGCRFPLQKAGAF